MVKVLNKLLHQDQVIMHTLNQQLNIILL